MAPDQIVTLDQATAMARQFNVLTVQAATFAPYLAAMHLANPNLKILVYENAAFSYSTSGYPASYYAHTAGGQLVMSTTWQNYLMDMSNPDWVQVAAQLCADARAQTPGFDGCYYDMLTIGPMLPGFLDGTPVDPSTGQAWLTANYVSALVNAVHVIRSANPGVPIVGNTLSSLANYFNTDGTSTRPVLDLLDGGHAEDFLRTASTPLGRYPNTKTWLNSVNAIADATARGDTVLTQTKLWTTATTAQSQSWYKFAVASFLLASDGNTDYFTFSTDRTMAAETTPLYGQINAGSPLAPFGLAQGVYQRRFTNGLVVVNPTANSVTMALPAGAWTTLDGAIVTGQLTVAPETGDVLSPAQHSGTLPTISAPAATSITSSSAVIPVTVDPEGLVGITQVDYGPNPTLGSVSLGITIPLTKTTVNIALTGLKKNTTYTYHAEVTTLAGTQVSANSTFTTPLPAPYVVTSAATVLDPTNANLTGTVNAEGLSSTYHFDYGLDTTYGMSTFIGNAGSATTAVTVNANVSGLTIGSSVHYRLEATNSTGTTYGVDHILNMPPPPVPTTRAAVTGTTAGTATLQGTVNPNGTDTHYWFQWDTSTSYSQSTPTTDIGSATTGQSASATITGLISGTIYHYRLAASNASGTTYGLDHTYKAP